jgi:hypothetical protein
MTGEREIEIKALEQKWMDAWRLRNRTACEEVLGSDFVLTSARGILMDREQWLSAAMGPFECREFEWQDLRVRMVAEHVAVVHGRERQVASVQGQDWSGIFLVTDVWVRRSGRWFVVARHGTGPLPTSGS